MCCEIKIGDKVSLNDKYVEYEDHKDEVFEVIGFGNVCGTEVAYLKGTGAYALDGLKPAGSKPAEK